ncbi:hypothetical protein N9W28_01355 [Alphaproteobacteria bacterium]|nr:hypothetical protein [Alphaproteobacteria bacterium]
MRKYYWLRRQKPSSHLISDYSQSSRLEDRYIQDSGIRFVSPAAELGEFLEPLEERVEVRVDCQVSVGGVSCGVEVGKLGLEISGNEPTEQLKNIKKALHPRFVPSAPMMYHDPKYGGWIDPYEVRSKPKKKEKKYEYY